jgi:protocatechuate 3,4-dioxygenase beta subunit
MRKEWYTDETDKTDFTDLTIPCRFYLPVRSMFCFFFCFMKASNLLIVFIFIAAFSFTARAQPCGGGLNTLTVTDANGQPVKEVKIAVRPTGQIDERLPDQMFRQEKDAPEKWKIEFLMMQKMVEKYLITMTAPGYVPHQQEVNFTSCGQHDLEAKLERLDPGKSFFLTGTVSDEEGRILRGTHVVVVADAVPDKADKSARRGPPPQIETFSDDDGKYRMEIALGKYYVVFYREGLEPARVYHNVENKKAGSVTRLDGEIKFEPPAAGAKDGFGNVWNGLINLEGRVLDRVGRAIEGATLTFTPVDLNAGKADKKEIGADKKDIVVKAGWLQYQVFLKPGVYRLRVEAGGYAPYVIERYRVQTAVFATYLSLDVVLEGKPLPGKHK